MMITTTSIYGIKAVSYLAIQPEHRFVPIREISDQLGIPFQYLTKLLQRLQQGGIILSRRGNTGGVALACSASDITLAGVLEVLEPTFIRQKCFLHDNECGEVHCCRFGEEWCDLQKKIQELLNRSTIDGIADQTGMKVQADIFVQK